MRYISLGGTVWFVRFLFYLPAFWYIELKRQLNRMNTDLTFSRKKIYCSQLREKQRQKIQSVHNTNDMNRKMIFIEKESNGLRLIQYKNKDLLHQYHSCFFIFLEKKWHFYHQPTFIASSIFCNIHPACISNEMTWFNIYWLVNTWYGFEID